MFTDKGLCEDVKTLKDRLDELERRGYGKRIAEVRRANRELERAHRVKSEELQRANHKLDVRLGVLQKIAAVLLAVLSGVAVYYASQYRESVEQTRKPYDIMLDVLQDKLGKTLDQVSLLAPTDEAKAMVDEVDGLVQKFSRMDVESEKFEALSELTNALKLIVNEGKGKEASAQIDKKALAVNKDRFVASRALVLQAMTLVQPTQQCNEPERTMELLSGAIQRDSRVAAAYNLLGVCLAEESKNLMYKQPEQWQRAGEAIQAALRNNELAYQLMPTPWSRNRLLNNRVWETSEFLLAALSQNRLNESLPSTGHKTMEEFFDRAVKDLEECNQYDRGQPAYMETLAELHGLECAFYRSPAFRDERKAEAAYAKMVQTLAGAIDKGLLKKLNDPVAADEYFAEDDLLVPLFADPANPNTLDRSIRALIERRVRPH
jgi:hypothetical protein